VWLFSNPDLLRNQEFSNPQNDEKKISWDSRRHDLNGACSCQWWGTFSTKSTYQYSILHLIRPCLCKKQTKLIGYWWRTALPSFAFSRFAVFWILRGFQYWFYVHDSFWSARSSTLFCWLLLCIWQISLHQHLKDYIYDIYIYITHLLLPPFFFSRRWLQAITMMESWLMLLAFWLLLQDNYLKIA
jgi:hypothetical protein